MKKILVFAVMLLMVANVANATDWYFAQDDVVEYHNGNPLTTPGVSFIADGTIANWSAPNTVIANYQLASTALVSFTGDADEWFTTYQTTLTISDLSGTLWSGSGTVTNIVQKNHVLGLNDGYTYTAPFVIPNLTEDYYESYGYGSWTKSAGTWTNPIMLMDWMGTYDQRTGIGNTIMANAQGRLQAVPEPISMILGAMGLAAVGGFKRFRK